MTDSRRFELGETLQVKIERLVFSGPGLARTEKGVVFVDFACPGDTLLVKIKEVKKNFSRAEILEIQVPSPERRAPPCPVFGKCGGCDWQHLSEESQLKEKHKLISELFLKEFYFHDVDPPKPSPKNLNYRNRIQVTWSVDGPSFRAKRSHELVPFQNCWIAEDSINKQLQSFNGKAGLRYQFSNFSEPKVLDLPELPEATPSDFSQVNEGQNEEIKSTLGGLLKPGSYSNFIDLYCGAGNFSFFLWDLLRPSTGVCIEGNPESIRQAHLELKKRKLSNHQLSFVCSDVQRALPRLLTDEGTLVFVDPPREGCSPEVSQMLSEAQLKELVYLSCDPMTLVRDLKVILRNPVLRIEKVILFDMFPQTSHCEVLVWVQKTR